MAATKMAWLPNGLLEHSLERPDNLIEGAHVLDIGPGVRPMPWYQPATHLCAEPHAEYALRLHGAGYNVLRGTAQDVLPMLVPGSIDSVFMLDVIEHMLKGDGFHVLTMLARLNPKQVVIFTPHGFVPQHGDAWGLNGAHWQQHRSGWTPADFSGWEIQDMPKYNAFFAIRTLA